MNEILITGSTLITPQGRQQKDLAIKDGVITTVESLSDKAKIIEADGCYTLTGLVDLNARVGEPYNPSETFRSATRAAVCGGFTTIVAQPEEYIHLSSTDRTGRDSAADISYLKSLAKDTYCQVLIAAAATIGEQLSPMAELKAAGVTILSNPGNGIDSALLMRRVLEYASSLGLCVAQRCQSHELCADTVIDEGPMSTRLGLDGNPAAAEHIRVARDLALAELANAKLHIQTITSARSLKQIEIHREEYGDDPANRSGHRVTVEVAAHHLLLDHSCALGYNPNTVLNPPLRTPQDRKALLKAVEDGVIDAVVSAHSPVPLEAKDRAYELCEPGTTGLETAMSTALSAGLSIEAIATSMSWKPAEIAGLGTTQTRNLDVGSKADIVIIDPEADHVVDTSKHQSLAKNTITESMTLTGQVKACIVAGELRAENGTPREK